MCHPGCLACQCPLADTVAGNLFAGTPRQPAGTNADGRPVGVSGVDLWNKLPWPSRNLIDRKHTRMGGVWVIEKIRQGIQIFALFFFDFTTYVVKSARYYTCQTQSIYIVLADIFLA